MSFKNLESRFNENVNKLYAGAKNKFENGKASNGRNDDPLIVRSPGDGYWNFAESRSLPIISGINDVKRLTLFTLSTRGILFLAKQQLLQTGNAFEQTRLINPLFAIGNAVPFLHLRRNARPLTGPYGILKRRPSTTYTDVRTLGQLQKSTYDSFDAKGVGGFFKKLLSPITNTVSAFTAKKNIGEEFGGHGNISIGAPSWKKSRPELGSSDDKYTVAKKLIRRSNLSSGGLFGAINAITNILNNSGNFDQGGSIVTKTFSGQLYGSINKGSKWDGKYTTYLKITNAAKEFQWDSIKLNNTDYKLYTPKKLSEIQDFSYRSKLTSDVGSSNSTRSRIKDAIAVKELDTAISNYVKKQAKDSEQLSSLPRAMVKSSGNPPMSNQTVKGVSYIKYFTYGAGTIKQASEEEIVSGNRTNAALVSSTTRRLTGKTISYIKDESNNKEPKFGKNNLISKEAYNRIENNFDDPIVVSFAMGKDGHVRFRAYIKDLQQIANPQYNPLQYIGRMEKFIYYTGVQREVSFKLGLLAFSKDELDGMWRRINFLTGMAYPYGFNKGIFQPNIIRMTIGDVYRDQPGYITSVNTNFNDITETWELDSGKQVPISATMVMNFTLIEKASRVADSPFYGIVENIDGFSNQIPVPTTATAPSITQPAGTAAPSANSSTQVKVNSTMDLFKNPFGGGNRDTSRVNLNPFGGGTTTLPPFTGFGGGGGFSGGGGGSGF